MEVVLKQEVPDEWHHSTSTSFSTTTPSSSSSSSASSSSSPSSPASASPVASSSSACTSVARQLRAQCAVCSSRATGSHYGIFSCNGCKTFFRRAVIDGRRFVCPRSGKCALLPSTEARLACRACRLALCLRAGMDKSAIQRSSAASTSSSVATAANTPQASSLLFVGERSARLIAREVRVLRRWHRLRRSEFFPYDSELCVSTHIVTRPTFSKAERYSEIASWPRLPDRSSYPGPLYRDVLVASGNKLWVWMDVFLTIDYLKTLPCFAEFDSQQQLEVAWRACVPLLILTTSFFSQRDGYTQPVYPNGVVVSNCKFYNYWGRHMNVFDILERTSMDETQFALLMHIVSLAGVAQISNLDTRLLDELRAARRVYTRALLEHTLTRVGETRGMLVYADLLLSLNELIERANRLRDGYIAMQATQLFCPSTKLVFEAIYKPNELTIFSKEREQPLAIAAHDITDT